MPKNVHVDASRFPRAAPQAVAHWLVREWIKPVAPTSEILEAMGDRLVVIAALQLLLGDVDVLSNIAARSYGHKNGFDKVVFTGAEGRRVRLHVWGSQGQIPDTHNHRWDFSSIVLASSFVQRTYTAKSASSGDFRNFTYRHAEDGSEFTLSPHGRATLTEESRSIVRPLASYTLAAETLHTFQPEEAATPGVALVIQEPAHRMETDVYAGLDRGNEIQRISVPIVPMSSEIARTLLETAIKRISDDQDVSL